MADGDFTNRRDSKANGSSDPVLLDCAGGDAGDFRQVTQGSYHLTVTLRALLEPDCFVWHRRRVDFAPTYGRVIFGAASATIPDSKPKSAWDRVVVSIRCAHELSERLDHLQNPQVALAAADLRAIISHVDSTAAPSVPVLMYQVFTPVLSRAELIREDLHWIRVERLLWRELDLPSYHRGFLLFGRVVHRVPSWVWTSFALVGYSLKQWLPTLWMILFVAMLAGAVWPEVAQALSELRSSRLRRLLANLQPKRLFAERAAFAC